MWPSIRYRSAQAVALALLAALISACAGFAPLYERALEQALIDVKLAALPAPVEALTLTSTPSLDVRTYPRAPLFGDELEQLVPHGLRRFYGAPTYQSSAEVDGGTNPSQGELEWRSGACAHLTFTTGACPTGPDEIAVSTADARTFGLVVGVVVTVTSEKAGNGETAPISLHVTGTYRQRPSPIWFGERLTGRSGTPAPADAASQHAHHDVWLTSLKSFHGADHPPFPATVATTQLPLRDAAVGVDQLAGVGRAIDALTASTAALDASTRVSTYSGLPQLAKDIAQQRTQPPKIVPLLMVQLALLGLVVLWLVLSAASDQRRGEIALEYLRGQARRPVRARLLAELLVVTVPGVVAGGLLAVALVWLTRTALLPGDAPRELTRGFWLALAAALAAIVLATVVAVVRVTREEPAALLRRVPPRRSGWGLGLGEAVVVAMSGTAVLAFATGGLSGPLALAAPTLLALTVGVLLAHVAGPLAARAGRRQLARGHLVSGVGLLDAARNRSTRRTIAIVTVATALLSFCTDALVVGADNRGDAARQEAGAATVVEVFGTDLPGVLATVRTLGTRHVTPVLTSRSSGPGAPETVAVDPAAFSRIALRTGDPAQTALPARALAPPTVPPLVVRGTSLAVDVRSEDLHSTSDTRAAGGPIGIAVRLLDRTTGETVTPAVAAFDSGVDRTVHASVPVACAGGCALVGLQVSTRNGSSVEGLVTLSGLVVTDAAGTATPTAIGPATAWSRYDDPEDGSLTPVGERPDQLQLQVVTRGRTPMVMNQGWIPDPVRVAATGTVSRTRVGLTGLDARERPARVVGRVARVPGARRTALVVDLDAVSRGSSVDPQTRITLWSDRAGPAERTRITRALKKHGIAVAGTTTLASVQRGYARSAAAWSLALAIVVGLAALLIGVVVVVVLAVTGWRLRARDLAALRMAGLGDHRVRRAAVFGPAVALVLAVLAGTACGTYGAQLALPDVPLFAHAPEVSTVDLSPAWPAVLLTLVVALAVLVLAGVLAGRAQARRARLEILRDSL